jgi:hypothetical protein
MKFYLEEFKEGYFVKYDGFRTEKQFTVLTPEGRVGEFDTRVEALKKLCQVGGYYGHKINIDIPYSFAGEDSKYILKKIKNGEYAGKTVCVYCRYTDGYCIIETGTSGPDEESVITIVHENNFE